MSAIEVAGVTRRFGDFTAVSGVSFYVTAGEVVGLVGANGAGKTTVMRMILGLLAPDEGKISLLGRDPQEVDRSRMGYVPQGLGLYRDLTVAENLAFTAGAFRVDPPDLESDLADVIDRPVGQISLGLRRRLAFATVLSHRPEVLFLDEPTSGVGPLGRINLWDQIRAQSDDGAAVLVSTHYMEEAEQCDRVLLMAEGALVADGSIEDVIGGRTTPLISGVGGEEIARLGITAIPDGDGWRMPGADPDGLREMLGPEVSITVAPMVFEEAFLGTS